MMAFQINSLPKSLLTDRDRDRQREQQRKERAQMLPDDKEIHASTQDLFHAPVKVKPSVEDTTTVQIRNTLGNFDTVRHLMIDPSKRLNDLVGVDQRFLPTAAQVASHRLTNTTTTTTSHAAEPPPYRPPASGGGQSSFSSSSGTDLNSNKRYQNNPRNLYPNPVNHTTSSGGSSQKNSTTSSSFRSSIPPANNPAVQKVPHSQTQQLPQHNSTVLSANSTTNLSVPVPIASDSGPILNTTTRSPNLSSVFNNEPIVVNKSSKSSSQCKKPALERADSQLDLESMLKEMMDVTPPLTAIQTPVKETKKLTQRRSSKSEEKIVQSIINSGMANVPSPVKRMDSSDGSSSSYETSSDSESEDSSSGSHPGGDKNDISVAQVASSTSSPTTRWNLGAFLKTTVESSSGKPGTKSPKDGKTNSYGSINSETIDDPPPHTDRGDSVTSTVSNKSQSASPLESADIQNSSIASRSKFSGRTRGTTEPRPEIPPRQIPPTTIPTKGAASSSNNNKVSSLTTSSSSNLIKDEVDVKPSKKPVISKSVPFDGKNKAPPGGPSTRKRPRQTAQSSSAHKSDGESSPESNPSKNSKNGQDKNLALRKLFRLGATNKPGVKVESPNVQESSSNPSKNSDKKKDGPKEKRSSHAQGRQHPTKLDRIIKEDIIGKSSSSPSSLIVRIPLEKLRRKPPLASDSVSVSTTPTLPVENDVVQAPDSSLNPPHLPSPFVSPQQLSYFSYFEKNEQKDDLFKRDQDSYLEEAKKLKHNADGERTSTTQASMYLEAGLYFILTGILMERDNSNTVSSNAPYTMYRDTLTLIQYIGSRWRSNNRQEMLNLNNLVEAKIIILSMRCQALLFLKLFKIKMKETKEMVVHMNDYFTKTAPRDALTISNSPQLSTPSPHSPTSSPAGSSGVLGHTPSPHHPQQNHLIPIPRGLHSQIHKHCSNTYHVIMAHDTWEQADAYVAKYHVEDFFIEIDRSLGPLTLHSSLVDLVRYVKLGLQNISNQY